MLGTPYHTQSQGAIEAFINRFNTDFVKHTIIYQNLMKRKRKKSLKETWSLDLMINSFIHYYNWKRKLTTTGYIPREVFFNYNNEEIIKDVIINTEKTRSKFL